MCKNIKYFFIQFLAVRIYNNIFEDVTCKLHYFSIFYDVIESQTVFLIINYIVLYCNHCSVSECGGNTV